MLPIAELRVGLPLAIIYSWENHLSSFPIFLLIIGINMLTVLLIFLFLDHLHYFFLKSKLYTKLFNKTLKKMQKKVDKFEKNHSSLGFLALTLFVGIPIPITGAWTASIAAWTLGLDRKKSILAIILGIAIAGSIIYMGMLGAFSLFF